MTIRQPRSSSGNRRMRRLPNYEPRATDPARGATHRDWLAFSVRRLFQAGNSRMGTGWTAAQGLVVGRLLVWCDRPAGKPVSGHRRVILGWRGRCANTVRPCRHWPWTDAWTLYADRVRRRHGAADLVLSVGHSHERPAGTAAGGCLLAREQDA